MRKPLVLGAIAALGISSQALAADGFSYNNVELGYGRADWSVVDGGEGITSDGDGFSISGSAEFSEHLFGFASLGSLTLDDVEYDGVDVDGVEAKIKPLTIGIGFHWPLASSLDFVSGLSFERLKATVSDGVDSFGSSENGFGVSAGLRGRVGDSLELTGTLKYLDIEGSDFVYSVGGRYYFTEAFAAGIDYTKYDDADLGLWGVSFRYDFGSRN